MKVLSEDEWFRMVAREEGELIASQTMDQVLLGTYRTIFDRHIKSQLVPFSVGAAHQFLLDMIQVYSIQF